jgi:hypothetical protein
MNGKLVVAFVTGLVVVAVVAFAGWHRRAVGQPAPQAQQWEYKLDLIEGDAVAAIEKTMNARGAEGLEFSAMFSRGDRFNTVVFKRPKK